MSTRLEGNNSNLVSYCSWGSTNSLTYKLEGEFDLLENAYYQEAFESWSYTVTYFLFNQDE